MKNDTPYVTALLWAQLNIPSNDGILTSLCPFHKTLPRSSAFINWISVRFYETIYFKLLKYYGFHTSNQKVSGKKKVYILAKDVYTEQKFESMPKKLGLKKVHFLVHPNSGS